MMRRNSSWFLPLSVLTYQTNTKRNTEACGIISTLGTSPNAHFILLEGLTILQTKGYDSAGIVTISPSSTFRVDKYANTSTRDAIASLRSIASQHAHIGGMAHTRWATHGMKSVENAHPHLDSSQTIAVVHNGSLLNASQLRKELIELGIVLKSTTDSELIAQYIGYFAKENPEWSLQKSTRKALELCHGTWGIVVMGTSSPNEMIVAQHGSPMVIGVGMNQVYASSDLEAIQRHTENIVELQDGEIAVLRAGMTLTNFDQHRIKRVITHEERPESPDPYPHWTIREIQEQPDAIYRALSFGGRMTQSGVTMGGLERHEDLMLGIQNLQLVGCGSSYHAALYGARIMRWLGSFTTASAHDSGGFYPRDLTINEGGLLAVSASGKNKSVLEALKFAQDKDVPVLSVTNGVGSKIATTTKIGGYQNAGPEYAGTSTKTFSTQVTVLALIASWFAEHREKGLGVKEHRLRILMQALQRLPISFKQVLLKQEECKEVAAWLTKADTCFLLGSDWSSAIALEGAQKLKELGCLHARAVDSLKEVPPLEICSTPSKVPFIVLIFGDKRKKDTQASIATAQKLHRAGHDVLIITNQSQLPLDCCKQAIMVPDTGPLSALVGIAPLQMIAYELSLLRNLSPDNPRNIV